MKKGRTIISNSSKSNALRRPPKTLLLLGFMLISLFSFAQEKYDAVSLDISSIQKGLRNAPMEGTPEVKIKFITVNLPVPGGEMVEFRAITSPILDDEMARRHPEVKTYAIQGMQNPAYVGRLMLSSRGVDAYLFTPNGDAYIEPIDLGGEMHKVYTTGQTPVPHLPNDALSVDDQGNIIHQHDGEEDLHSHPPEGNPAMLMMMNYEIGPQLRNFRMHVITDGEYSVAVCGANPTRACVETAIMAALNGMNAFYTRDMAIKLSMTANTTIYLNGASDPFAAGGGAMNPEWNCESVGHHQFMETNTSADGGMVPGTNQMVPESSYDVGHLFSGRVGAGSGGGGVAFLESVCNNSDLNCSGVVGPQKAGGGSGIVNPQGSGWVNLLAHEFTHQFNADHTWSGNSGFCTPDQWSGPPAGRTSYEPGGGSTIVSYADICMEDNIPNLGNINYYHTASIKEVNDYIASAGVTCENNTASGNLAPTPSVTSTGCTPNFSIPIRTPFEITGSATDDGPVSSLTYCWEQFDLASSQHDPIVAPTMTNTNNAPATLFPIVRSFAPSSSPTRTFPKLSTIASGNYNGDAQTAATLTQANWQGELLPEVAGRITMRLTVRDNNIASGGVEFADALINVVPTAGPYAVTAPNGGENIMSGTLTTVTWNTAGTENAPISCNTVNIKLSADGGLTYPYTLVAGTGNDGSESVTIPTNVPNSTTARIRVECGTDCFKFFDISNTNFTITSTCLASASVICPSTAMTVAQGPAANLSLNSLFNATAVTSLPFAVTASDPTGSITGASMSGGTTCMVFGATANYTTQDFVVDATGNYALNLNSANSVVSIFTAAGYNPASPCTGATFIASNFDASTGSSTSTIPSIMLSACTTYKLVAWSQGPATGTASFTTAPGTVYTTGTAPGADYCYTYAAVNTSNNQIIAQSSTADFSGLSGGSYCVYGASYKCMGTTPPAIVNPTTWTGMTIAQVLGSGNCVVFSDNCKPLTITPSSCTISNVTATTPVCSGTAATFTVSATVAGGSGNYNVVNAADNAVLGTVTGGTMSGAVMIASTFAGATGQTIMINVIDTGTTGCVSSNISVTLPNCGAPTCSITGVTATTPVCSGTAATFTVSATIASGSGNYNVVNAADNAVLGTVTGGTMSGTVMIASTFAGATGQTIMINVIDTGTAGCVSSNISVTLPDCSCSVTGSAVVTNETCTGASDGTITVTATAMGCAGTLQYSLDGGTAQASNVFSNVAVGPHTVVVVCSTIPSCTFSIDAIIMAAPIDATPPMIICPANVTVACDASTLPADTGMATATDNCTTAPTITFSDASTQGTGCSAFSYNIIRTWTATDGTGNTAICEQTITVQDNTPPAITCPANQNVVCNTDPLPTAVTIAEFVAIGGTASDNCSSAAELTVSFVDSPSNQSMLNFCPGTSEADRTLTRTYRVTDACGNSSTCVQQFIYAETQNGPIITAIPLDQTVDCAVNAFSQLALFTAEGDCSSISYNVSGPSNSGTPGCSNSTIQYTYTATDNCGRSATHVQTYTLTNEGPQFVCPVDICVIECPADTDMIQTQFDSYSELATVITSCSETSVTISNNFNPNGFISQNCANPTIAVPGAVAYQVVRFTATDACGRNGTCTALVVLKDSNGPVMTGNLSTGLADCNDVDLQEGYTAWASFQLNGLSATDECSNGVVSFSYAPLSPNVDCSSGLASTEVSFIASDACGNETIITTFYRIIDNGTGEPIMATVSGNLMTESNEMVALANVAVEGSSVNQMMTNDDGYYHFDLARTLNYSIIPTRNDNPLNGITTYDLILLGQHLLEMTTLDSPYKLIAADVNESGHISSLDMIELRRLILHIDDEFSSGKSWTFVDAAYEFPQPTNPFATTFPRTANINNLSSSQVINFVGVKLGDLNATANVSALQAGDTRSSDGSLNIKLEDEQLKAGQTYNLAFKASDFKNVTGFQFTLDFAAKYLKLADYQSSELTNMSANNFGFTKAKEGKITVSWNETQGVNMLDDATLFEISFTALEAVQLSEVLAINSAITPSEAYQADLRKDVVLDFGTMISTGKEFALFQNQPNPFAQQTVIGFRLPEATEATLTIFDITGRVILTKMNTYEAGLHQILMDKADIEATGVFYYQLSTSEYSATKKMIVLK